MEKENLEEKEGIQIKNPSEKMNIIILTKTIKYMKKLFQFIALTAFLLLA
jgi:hypothetical protein